ncbi:CGNR zinc finger domain-containing protein [Methyloversatilis sp.]|uniref:CGNR zinc finger domain-containing protein n=1 Tax=Methyloversatilis sp. TaxID=2569862 RepID=UPI003F6F4271
MSEHNIEETAPRLVGDNLALDFINTEYGLGPLHREVLSSDQSVVDWLRTVGALPVEPERVPRGLLALARELRASARALVEARRVGRWADPAVVNQVLARGQRPAELRWDASAKDFRIERQAGALDAPGLLLPVAEALARLLVDVDPTLVRQCEGHNCTLLFQDITKSHRRRWCSMAVCGNRMKVAAFRTRRHAG